MFTTTINGILTSEDHYELIAPSDNLREMVRSLTRAANMFWELYDEILINKEK